MSNRKIFKRVFDEELNGQKMKQQILFKLERKNENKMKIIFKYAVIPICLILLTFMGISITKEKESFIDNIIGTVKVYAYTNDGTNESKKTELKDNIKLGLAKYNLSMSSVPGYPIEFEIDNIDYINIDIYEGDIISWNQDTGEISTLGKRVKLATSRKLYFNININTIIKITGIKEENEVFTKEISISSDDDFNYYALLK